MNNKLIIKSFVLTVALSSVVFAIEGRHGNINSSSDGSDNGEICVYCHTPHAANKDIGGPTPLWNKPVSTITFQMYGATTGGVAGQTLAGTLTDAQPSDQSLACLSCHDGVSAMNSVVNAPGSGLTGTGTLYNGEVLIGDPLPNTMPYADQTKAIGAPKAIDFVNGSLVYSPYGSLDNDHPVSITYMPGKASLREITYGLSNFFGANNVSDLLRNGKVQCVSCHDPHGTGNPRYLRTDNVGSSLCFGCHDK